MTTAPGAIACAAFIAGIGAGGVLVPGNPALGLAAIVAATVVLAVAVVVRPVLIALSLAAALFGFARAELAAGDPNAAARAASLAGQLATVAAVIAEDPRPTLDGFEVLVTPARIVSASGPLEPVGNLLVRVRGPGDIQPGDEVTLSGRLRLPLDRPGFNRRAYLAQRQAYLEVQVVRLDVVRRATGAGILAGLPGRLREAYRAAIGQLLPAPYSGLLVGVVLGLRSGIPAQLQKDLIATGLVHLLVLSGLKVAVLTRLAAGLLRPMLGRAAILPLLGLVALYAMVGGATPAAVRAAAMGGLVALALFLGRPSHVWTSLAAVAAAMLAWKPELIWDVGYQLSFVGTAAIILLTPPIEARLRPVPGLLREPFAVTLAAQVGTVPLMATDFHLISPSAPLANALVLPLLPALVLGGLLLPPLAVVPELGRIVALPLAGMLGYMAQVAGLLARLPAASFPAPDLSGARGLGYYLGIGALLGATQLEGRRRLALIATGILIPLGVGGAELAAWGRDPPRAAVLAVGEGEAVLLTGPSGHVLIDGGADPAKLAAEVGQRLPPWERRLAGLLLTGVSNPEVGGLAGLDRPALVLAVPAHPLQGSAWRRSVLPSLAAGAAVWSLNEGASFELAGLHFEVLAPEPGGSQLAIRVRGPSGRSFCDLGEMAADAQSQVAVRLAATHLTCDALLLPGGGHSPLDPALLSAARPARLIASLGSGRLDRTLPAARVERTDQEGTVLVPL